MRKYLDFFFQKLKDTLQDLWRQNSRVGDVMPHPILAEMYVLDNNQKNPPLSSALVVRTFVDDM